MAAKARKAARRMGIRSHKKLIKTPLCSPYEKAVERHRTLISDTALIRAKGDRHEPIQSFTTVTETTIKAHQNAHSMVHDYSVHRDGLRRVAIGTKSMMTGYVAGRYQHRPKARKYRVIANADGWSVALGEGCTTPFSDIRQAERIARELQKQADALSGGTKKTTPRSVGRNTS